MLPPPSSLLPSPIQARKRSLLDEHLARQGTDHKAKKSKVRAGGEGDQEQACLHPPVRRVVKWGPRHAAPSCRDEAGWLVVVSRQVGRTQVSSQTPPTLHPVHPWCTPVSYLR